MFSIYIQVLFSVVCCVVHVQSTVHSWGAGVPLARWYVGDKSETPQHNTLQNSNQVTMFNNKVPVVFFVGTAYDKGTIGWSTDDGVNVTHDTYLGAIDGGTGELKFVSEQSFGSDFNNGARHLAISGTYSNLFVTVQYSSSVYNVFGVETAMESVSGVGRIFVASGNVRSTLSTKSFSAEHVSFPVFNDSGSGANCSVEVYQTVGDPVDESMYLTFMWKGESECKFTWGAVEMTKQNVLDSHVVCKLIVSHTSDNFGLYCTWCREFFISYESNVFHEDSNGMRLRPYVGAFGLGSDRRVYYHAVLAGAYVTSSLSNNNGETDTLSPVDSNPYGDDASADAVHQLYIACMKAADGVLLWKRFGSYAASTEGVDFVVPAASPIVSLVENVAMNSVVVSTVVKGEGCIKDNIAGAQCTTIQGANNMLIISYTEEGMKSDAVDVGGSISHMAEPRSVGALAGGDVVVCGFWPSTMSFSFSQDLTQGSSVGVTSENTDMFVLRYSPAEERLVWVMTGGDIYVQRILHCTVDAGDNMYLSGWSTGTVEFNGHLSLSPPAPGFYVHFHGALQTGSGVYPSGVDRVYSVVEKSVTFVELEAITEGFVDPVVRYMIVALPDKGMLYHKGENDTVESFDRDQAVPVKGGDNVGQVVVYVAQRTLTVVNTTFQYRCAAGQIWSLSPARNTMVVAPTNDPAVCHNQSVAVAEDTRVALDFRSYVTDEDGNEAVSKVYVWSDVANVGQVRQYVYDQSMGQVGNMINTAVPTWVEITDATPNKSQLWFKPPRNFFGFLGKCVLRFRAVDESNVGCDVGCVEVTVKAVNDAPIPDDAEVVLHEGDVRSVELSATDVDSPTSELSFKLVSVPSSAICDIYAFNRTHPAELGARIILIPAGGLYLMDPQVWVKAKSSVAVNEAGEAETLFLYKAEDESIDSDLSANVKIVVKGVKPPTVVSAKVGVTGNAPLDVTPTVLSVLPQDRLSLVIQVLPVKGYLSLKDCGADSCKQITQDQLPLYVPATSRIMFHADDMGGGAPYVNFTISAHDGRSFAVHPAVIVLKVTCAPGTFNVVWCNPKSPRGCGSPCQKCPRGGMCSSEGLSNPVSQAGYYNAQLYPPLFLQCHPMEACRSGEYSPQSSQGCHEGYTGFLCGRCDVDYYRTSDQTCSSCSSKSRLYVILVLVSLVIAVGGGLLYLTRMNFEIGALNIVLTYFQTCHAFRSIELGWPSSSGTTLSLFSVFNLEFSVFGVECGSMSFSSRYILFTFLPVVVLLLLAALYVLARFLCVRRAVQRQLQFLCVKSSVVFIQFAYLSMSLKAMEPFSCSRNADGSWTLNAEPAIRCYEDSEWRKMIPFAVCAMVVYVIGAPLLFAYVLFVRRPRSRYSAVVNVCCMELKLPKRQGHREYQMNVHLRKNDPKGNTVKDALETNSAGLKDDTNYTAMYSTLERVFAPSAYWWSLVVMIRKFSVLLPVLLLPDFPLMQGMLALCVLGCSIVATSIVRPYKAYYKLNVIELLSLTSSYLVLSLGVMSYGEVNLESHDTDSDLDSDSKNKRIIGGVITAAVVVTCAWLGWRIISVVPRMWRIGKARSKVATKREKANSRTIELVDTTRRVSLLGARHRTASLIGTLTPPHHQSTDGTPLDDSSSSDSRGPGASVVDKEFGDTSVPMDAGGEGENVDNNDDNGGEYIGNGWTKYLDDEGVPYYAHENGTVQWQNPLVEMEWENNELYNK